MNLLDKYIETNTSLEDSLLHELDRETNLRVIQPRMISGHIQGKLLEMIVRMLKPKNVLEIGTFTGYSALCMAVGLEKDGIVDTIEADDELEAFARSFFNRSEHGHKIYNHIGSALEVAPKLGKTFDLIFIDGDKREYPDYYHMIMGDAPYSQPLIHSGSFLLADNILWYGKVAEEQCQDPHTKAIREFNQLIVNDNRVENVIIPLRDGLNLIRVK